MSAQILLRISVLLIALMTGTGLCTMAGFAQNGLTIDAVVLRDANLRSGPGITYNILGLAKAGQLVMVTDYYSEWYQLSSGEWISKFLVEATPESRVVAFRLEDVPAMANRPANTRSGPGTSYAIVGNVYKGQSLKIVGQNQTGDWLRLHSGQWIASFLIDRVEVGLHVVGEENSVLPFGASSDVPVSSVIQPTATPTVPITQPPSSSAQICDQSYPSICIEPALPDLNCDDIIYKDFQVIGSDPHGFDSDKDGIGCESR